MQYTEYGKTAKASESVEDFTRTTRRVPKKQSQKKIIYEGNRTAKGSQKETPREDTRPMDTTHLNGQKIQSIEWQIEELQIVFLF